MGTGTETEKETKTERMIGMRVESGMKMKMKMMMIVGSFQRQALSVIMREKAHLQKIGKIDIKTVLNRNGPVAIHLAKKWRTLEVKFSILMV